MVVNCAMNGIESNGQFFGFENSATTGVELTTLSNAIDEISDSIAKLVSVDDLERLRMHSHAPATGSASSATFASVTSQQPFKPVPAVAASTSFASNKRFKSNTPDNRSDKFLRPFEYGWKRELVYRAFSDPKQPKRNGEVYYYTPSGKKLRSLREIQEHIKGTLEIDCFSFSREPIGVGSDYETVRDAKNFRINKQVREHKSSYSVHGVEKNYDNGMFGWNMNRTEIENNRNLSNEIHSTYSKPLKKLSRTCTIHCENVTNAVPTLQCRMCLCLYHPECMGLAAYFQSPSNDYVCKNCDQPPVVSSMLKNDLQATAPAIKSGSKSMKTSSETRQNGIGGLGSSGGGISGISFSSSSSSSSLSSSTDRNLFKQCLVSIGDKRFIMVPKNVPSAKHRFPLPGLLSAAPTTILSVGNHSSNNRAIKPKPLSKRIKSLKMPENWLNRSNTMFGVMQKIFEYLPLVDACRAAQVCRLWNAASDSLATKNGRSSRIASNWTHLKIPRHVRITNCAHFIAMLSRRHTESLDLRNMLAVRPIVHEQASSNDSIDFWSEFEQRLETEPVRLRDLRHFYANHCPGTFPYLFAGSAHKLQTLSCGIQSNILTIPTFAPFENLVKLRLKSSGDSFTLQCGDFASFEQMRFLKHFALSLVSNLDAIDLVRLADVRSLEQLEIGECVPLTDNFVTTVLARLPALKRLRLEKLTGEQSTVNRMLNALSSVPHLIQLELINVDVRSGFDLAIGHLLAEKLQKFLIVPTYVTKSATTNHLILNTIIAMYSAMNKTPVPPPPLPPSPSSLALPNHNTRRCLSKFTWVVTTELLHVTQLFVNDCKSFDAARPITNGIPILKPLPSVLALNTTTTTTTTTESLASTDADVEPPSSSDTEDSVEIVSLDKLERSLTQLLRNTTVTVCKVPFSSTWEQTI